MERAVFTAAADFVAVDFVAVDFVAAVFFTPAAFLTGASSGWTSRRRPAASAFRRTRSAWASSMDEEALFTPIPKFEERSRISLLDMPSSFASSCTRIFFVAKTFLHFVPPQSDSTVS